MIEGYKNAAEKYSKGEMSRGDFEKVSQSLVDMIYSMEELTREEEDLNLLMPLADKVTAAIEEER
jgi:hypothetical protein